MDMEIAQLSARGWRFAGLLVSALLVACEDPAPPKRAESKIPENPALLQPATASDELDRLLRDRIRIRGKTVLLPDPLDVIGIPTHSNWLITCGFLGLSVGFGPVIAGDGDPRMGGEIRLSPDRLDHDVCAWLTPMLGEKLTALLRG